MKCKREYHDCENCGYWLVCDIRKREHPTDTERLDTLLDFINTHTSEELVTRIPKSRDAIDETVHKAH